MAEGARSTKHLTVVVKGDKFHAARAAADRGIPFAFVTETDRETVGRIPYVYLDCVAAWFASDADHGAPYPVGSCLIYSIHEPEPPRLCPLCKAIGVYAALGHCSRHPWVRS